MYTPGHFPEPPHLYSISIASAAPMTGAPIARVDVTPASDSSNGNVSQVQGAVVCAGVDAAAYHDRKRPGGLGQDRGADSGEDTVDVGKPG